MQKKEQTWQSYVKETRKMTGLTQGRFAIKLNVGVRTLRAWESGEIKSPMKLARQAVIQLRKQLSSYVGKSESF